MTPANIDTLTERVEGVREDVRDLGERLDAHRKEFGDRLEEHRREAAESAEKTRESLDEIKAQLAGYAETRKTVDELRVTVQGEKNEPGLTTRQDRSERTLFVLLWVVAAITLCTVGSIVTWVGEKIHVLNNIGAKP